MSVANTEQVMVVKAELLRSLGYFQGFTDRVDQYLGHLLSDAHTTYYPRSQMEEDPSFKQLIPYVVIRHRREDGQVTLFRYTRGKGQGESRLHLKQSIGIGGHISTEDIGRQSPYREGMRRELAEEVSIGSEWTESCVGLINDDSNEVGQVHLGVVHLVDVESPRVTPLEDDILDAGFTDLPTLRAERDQLETWSQICLDHLF